MAPTIPLTVIFAVLISSQEFLTCAEIYSAQVDLERALNAEQNLAKDLYKYVDDERQRLNYIESFADLLHNHSSQLLTLGGEVHLSNPVNAFLLVKRFALDWKDRLDNLIQIMTDNARVDFQNKLRLLSVDLPNEEDLKGATDALLRLQDTYQLSTHLLARGQLGRDESRENGSEIVATEELSADECMNIALHAWTQKDLYHAKLWLDEALDRLGPLDVRQTRGLQTKGGVKRAVILDYLAYAVGQHGNYQKALVLTNEWLTLEPSHQRALNNKAWYERQLREQVSQHAQGDLGKKNDETAPRSGWHGSEEYQRYEALCRGEVKGLTFPRQKQRVARHKLFCHLRVPHPHYIIGPLREEEIELNPRLVLLYNVIHPFEIKHIQKLAIPRLNRATVQHPVTGELITAHYRVSKSAWLPNNLDKLIYNINERIKAITGLSIDTAEDLQVSNYGIGGQYEPHYDFARRREKSSFENSVGNRIATFLYYLSDVERGGATVFTELGISIRPVAGAAAFWYNLHRNGDGIMSTRHAACPVLFGSKWVMNKWFHERGQELVRPCALDANV